MSWIVRGVSEYNRVPMAYQSETRYKNQKVRVYTEEHGYKCISLTQYKEINKKPLSSKYVLVCDKDYGGENLEETLKNFKTLADKLYDLDSSINLYRTGEIKLTALYMYKMLINQHVNKLEWLTPVENRMIQDATRGSLIFGTPYEGQAHYYDIVSAYMYILSHHKFRIPIKQGVEYTMSSEEFSQKKFYPYGLYRVKVEGYDHRLFRPSEDDTYTHYDLEYAHSQGYKLSIVDDGEPNVLLYPAKTHTLSGKELFGDWVRRFFKFKKEGHKEIKKFFTIIWGALCQSNQYIKTLQEDEIFDVDKDNYITDYMDKEGNTVVVYCPFGQRFKTPLARLKPFLQARCRIMMANIMGPQIDDVVRCHTDGFYMKTKLKIPDEELPKVKDIDAIRIGDQIGDLKYEKVKVKVLNAMKVQRI